MSFGTIDDGDNLAVFPEGYHLKNPGLKAHALAGCHEGGKLA